jgi:DNA-directed RNA polymerase subunit K/omega
MFKELFGALIVASQITTAAYSYNAKRLDSEAEECITKIWAGIRLKDKIKDHLHFLSDAEIFPQKYTEVSSFDDFCETTVAKIQDFKFRQFVEDCKCAYEEGDITPTKFAVLMLVEKVGEKYERGLLKAVRATARSNQAATVAQPDTDSILKAFFNADNDITIKY